MEITAKHTGAKPEIIRVGSTYQDRNGRLLQSYSPAASSSEGGKGRRGVPCGACRSDHLLAGLSRVMASASV